MTTRRCGNCAYWYDARMHDCPECGKPKHKFNAGLVSQQWQTALNARADWADKNC
jgi:RNA polymerase subunit RPABC4/transcription elongation factor Spt4